MSHIPDPGASAPRMRFGRFFTLTGLQVALALVLFWFFAPLALSRELHSPAALLPWAIVLGVPLSLFEYFYHRYLLHSAVLPFLGIMHKEHMIHHGLTSVKAPVNGSEPFQLVPVKSEYPVEHEHQEEAMEFPFFSISIFMAMFTVLLGIPLKLLFPGSPIFLSVLLSVTLYYSSYELWHAVLHLPFERFWKPAMDNRWIGKLVRHAYSFHLMHHWRPTANLAIVGLWGFALWDHVFRTHHRPLRMPLQGAFVAYSDIVIPKPLWPIALLDRWRGSLQRTSRRVEAWAARVFLRRSASR